MRERCSLWRALTLCLACALPVAAFSCGDDSSDDGGGGTGGDSGSGGGGSGGSGGKGGAGGKTGGSGGKDAPTVTAAECVKQTNDFFKGRSDGYSSECVSCICDEEPDLIAACNDADNCWELINCVGTKCAGTTGSAQTSCATSMCLDYLTGAGAATPAGPVLQGDACAAKCVGDVGMDGGVDDAGM